MELIKCKLSDLGSVSRGKSKHRPRNDSSLFGGKYPFIQTGEVKAAEFYINSFTETYNERGLDQSKLWDENTLLITIAANIAETAILDIKACFPDSILGFIPYQEKSDVIFVKYYIDFIKRKLQNISQGTTQDNMSVNKLLSMWLYVPNYVGQQKIASILSNYDKLIENNTQRIKLLEFMAEELYKEWFVRLRFPGYEDVEVMDDLPVGWERKPLSEFGKIITGKTPSTKKSENFDGDIPFIKTPDFKQGTFIVDTEETLSVLGANSQKNQYISAYSICVSCIGTIGEITISRKPSQTNQQINSIELEEKTYLEYLFVTIKMLKPLIEMYASSGATMGNLNKTKFSNLKVIKPKDEIVKKYHMQVAAMFDEIEILQLKNQTLKQTRDLLLPRLMSGKLNVEDLDII